MWKTKVFLKFMMIKYSGRLFIIYYLNFMSGFTFAQVVQFSLWDLFGRLLSILPDLLGAFLILLVGLIVAPILGGVVKKVIDLLKIDLLAEKMGVKELAKGYSSDFSISLIIGKLVKWFFALAFIMAAADVLGWTRVTMFLNEIILYIPQVLIAIVILVFGIIAGNFFGTLVTRSLQASNAPVNRPEIIGKITKWSLVIFAVLAALFQIGIAPSLIQILFTGIVLAIALAVGLGGRKKVEEILDEVYSKPKKASKK